MDARLAWEATTAIATATVAVGGICALACAMQELKHFREAAKLDQLTRFSSEFNQEPMTKWRKTLAEKRLRGERFPQEAIQVLDFFEKVGLYVSRGFLDDHDVWSLFSAWLFVLYADFHDKVEQLQKEDQNSLCLVCKLVERLRDIEKKEKSSSDRPSEQEIRQFWQAESSAFGGASLFRRKVKSRVRGKKAPVLATHHP